MERENQNPSVSIRGQLSHPLSKVPSRLLKANKESLFHFLFWRKLRNLKALFSLILTSKEVKENAFATATLTSWAQCDTTLQENIDHIQGLDENRLVIQILRHFGQK